MPISFRMATYDDLFVVVNMLANDVLGATRESITRDLHPDYLRAFESIENDVNNHLIVACENESVIGCLQLTFIPNLTYQGAWRALIEGVRVHEEHRGKGVGEALFQYAIEAAQAKNCRMVQLTTNKARPEALRFYQRLGFEATHEGMKLMLDKSI